MPKPIADTPTTPTDDADPPEFIRSQLSASYDADSRAARAGMLLADFECQHGRLPTDATPPCGCFPHERRPILAAPILPAEPTTSSASPAPELPHDTPLDQLLEIRAAAIRDGRLPKEATS